MLGEAIIDSDVTLTGAGPAAALTALGPSIRFYVEEEEMFVDLKGFFTASYDQADEVTDFTMLVDDVDIAAGAAGLFRKSWPSTASDPDLIAFERTVRLAKGEHKLQLAAMIAGAGHTLTIEGATWAGYVTARRHSHPATAAANANSKVQGVY